MNIEHLVKAKLRLEEQNKILKKEIDNLKFDSRWKDSKIKELKEKLKEIRLISGGTRFTMVHKIKKWLR